MIISPFQLLIPEMRFELTFSGHEPNVLAVILPWSSGYGGRTCYH